jgi:hypothetical protein
LDDDGSFREEVAWIRFEEEGLYIDFPPLCAGENVAVVFTAAWAFEPTSHTHFAADAALGGDRLWGD